MTPELWLEKRCVHGFINCAEMICDHQPGEHPKDGYLTFSACWCPGGSRVRLDPDEVVAVPITSHIGKVFAHEIGWCRKHEYPMRRYIDDGSESCWYDYVVEHKNDDHEFVSILRVVIDALEE